MRKGPVHVSCTTARIIMTARVENPPKCRHLYLLQVQETILSNIRRLIE